MDIFERINKDEGGPLGQYRARGHGYFTFPKLEGEIAPRMRFNGHEVLCWSLNNYLGLANHPEIRKIDAEAAARWGLAYPMGSRMMSGRPDRRHFTRDWRESSPSLSRKRTLSSSISDIRASFPLSMLL